MNIFKIISLSVLCLLIGFVFWPSNDYSKEKNISVKEKSLDVKKESSTQSKPSIKANFLANEKNHVTTKVNNTTNQKTSISGTSKSSKGPVSRNDELFDEVLELRKLNFHCDHLKYKIANLDLLNEKLIKMQKFFETQYQIDLEKGLISEESYLRGLETLKIKIEPRMARLTEEKIESEEELGKIEFTIQYILNSK